MNINLITDAPKHNLALMKISRFHKVMDDNVFLNGVGCFDRTYGSWLFRDSLKGPCDVEGGPGIDTTTRLEPLCNSLMPDYDLYNLDYSLGYTWSYCPRKCPFCIVPKQNNPKDHGSIWAFHDPEFPKICLLNNNTFSDPDWRETFEEIWDEGLIVRDENGYDLRLMDDEKADALRKTKFDGYIHYAWDQMQDEASIVNGLKIAPRGMVYVLVGYDTTVDEDFHRCQVIHDHGHDPYVMPFNRTRTERRFQRFVNTRMYRRYKLLQDAWEDYSP